MALAAAAAALAVLWAGPAQAGTPIQLGQVATGNPDTCGAETNFVQRSVAAAPSYTVPSAGTITSWSHRAHNTDPGAGGLQVWRPAAGTNYTLVGGSDIKAFDAGTLHSFPISLPVSAGDVLGFRAGGDSSLAELVGCSIPTANPGDVFNWAAGFAGAPTPGTTVDLFVTVDSSRLNVSATLDPADDPGGDGSLDSSKTKGKQSVGKLKIKVTADQDSTLDLGGKGKVAQRVLASTAAKPKQFKLKKKTGIGLKAGAQKKIGLKFKENRKTVKRITKLLKRSKKARKNSKVIVNLTLTTAAGVASDSKLKIKLKP